MNGNTKHEPPLDKEKTMKKFILATTVMCAGLVRAETRVTQELLSKEMNVSTLSDMHVQDDSNDMAKMLQTAKDRAKELGADALVIPLNEAPNSKELHVLAVRQKGSSSVVSETPKSAADVVVEKEILGEFKSFFSHLKVWTPLKVYTHDGKVLTGKFAGTSPDVNRPQIMLRDPNARAFKQQLISVADIEKVQVLNMLPN